ncbi:MAG TPA: hypothetical protein VF897_14100, partial [Roseiflexaceae bacterium]
ATAEARPTETQPDTTTHPSVGYLVYQRPDGSLWRADGPGAQPIRLTEPTDPEALLPWAASPDGQTIAVVAGKGLWYQFRENPTLALWLVGADGSNPRKVQDLLPPRGVDPTPGGDDAFNLVPALTSEQRLAWSPDGRLVAFVSAHENQVDLYTAALDGTVKRLTDTPRLEQGSRWSPDGALVAYRTTTGFGTGAGWGDVALEVAPRGGGQPVFVMDDGKLAAGTQAQAIEDMFWIGPNTIIAGLWDMLAGKTEVRALTISPSATTVIFDAPYTALAWNDVSQQLAIAGTSASLLQSPIDKRKLAPGLYTWSPEAGAPAQVDREPVEALAWTPQGDALAYSRAGKQPGLRLWEIGAEGDLKTIDGQAATTLLWSPDGRQLAAGAAIYSRDGKKVADLQGPPARLIGWGPQGLFYDTPAEGSNRNLWLWDGVKTQQIDSAVTKTSNAGVVLAHTR